MKASQFILVFCMGIAVGVVFLFSCGDNGPAPVHAADAGTCDCPAAEPPLAGRILNSQMQFTLLPNSPQQRHGLGCPGGPVSGTVISGGCTAMLGTNIDVILEESYPDDQGWNCIWNNTSNTEVTVKVVVRCLMPVQ
jgi:hypothetical protein